MDLKQYWIGGKIKPIFSPSPKKLLLAAIVLAGISFHFGQSLPKETPRILKVLEQFPEIKLPEIVFDLSGTENADINADNAEPTSSAQLKIVSANLIAIYEETADSETARQPDSQPDSETGEETADSETNQPVSNTAPRLAGLRILGEYQNIGQTTANDVQAIIHFFDEDNHLLATKRAEPASPFRWLPLEPEQISLYDVVVPEPPPSARLQVELKEKKNQDPLPLSLEELKLKENELSAATSNNVNYHQFKGAIINVSEKTLTNILLYIWLKDIEGRVFAHAIKSFPYDLLAPDQELNVVVPVLPAKEGKMAVYEVKLWGEEMR